MKRYTIVRVDNRCPVEVEEDIYLTDRIKMFPCFNDKRLSCKNCRYGDTKEQFTRKIETAIEIAINRYEEGKIKGRNKNRQCAEIIVEFLGVE